MKKIFILITLLTGTVLTQAQESKNNKLINANIERGKLMLNSGEYEKAILNFQSALDISNNNIEALYGLGVAQSILCNTSGELCQKAIQVFDKVIKQDPSYRNAFYNRGTCYLSVKEYQNALRDFNNAIKTNPKDGDYYYNRALLFLELKEPIKACLDLKKSLELGILEANEAINTLCK